MIYGMVWSLISYNMIHINNMAQTFHTPYLWANDMPHIISYEAYIMILLIAKMNSIHSIS